MKLDEFLIVINDIAPTRHAEPWDNVGLIVGDPEQQISCAMLTIDYTTAVAEEALRAGTDLVIAYHPPLFQAVKRFTADSSTKLMFDAARRGVAVYSPHTAIDIAAEGTNDMLADVLGLSTDARRPLRVSQPQSTQCKLVIFSPVDAVEKVSEALFNAGAGRIGQYTHCSFRSNGTGTFIGEAGTNPTVGQAGKFETADEVRIETVLPLEKVTEAVAALRAAHPYEEAAFDLVQLAAAPEGLGQGRIGDLDRPTSLASLFDRIKRELSLEHLLIAGPQLGDVTRVACCAGSCGDLLDDAIKQGAQLYLTGEMKHHEALKASAAGMTVVCTLHSNSERAMLRRLQAKLSEKLPGLVVEISKMDRDPFTIR